MRTLLLALGAAAFAAPLCAQPPGGSFAAVEGDPSDLQAFVGEWVGGYACADTERHGTLVARIEASGDSVRAAILMVPAATGTDLVPPPIPLSVLNVTLTGQSFRGTLAPYRDPDWDLPLDTEFGGTLDRADRMEGYFKSFGSSSAPPRCGRWWATRAAESHASRTP